MRTTVGDGIYGRAPGSGIFTRRGMGGENVPIPNVFRDLMLASAPYAWWTMEETSGELLDHSGNARHATANAALIRDEASFLPGDIDPLARSVKIPAVPSTSVTYFGRQLHEFRNFGTWSLEMWVKVYGLATAATDRNIMKTVVGEHPPKLSAGGGSIPAMTMKMAVMTSWGAPRSFDSGVAITLDAVYHMVVACQPNLQQMYFNGVKKTVWTDSNVTFGGTNFWSPNPGDLWGVRVDTNTVPDLQFQHMLVYNSFVTEAQALERYNAGMGL